MYRTIKLGVAVEGDTFGVYSHRAQVVAVSVEAKPGEANFGLLLAP